MMRSIGRMFVVAAALAAVPEARAEDPKPPAPAAKEVVDVKLAAKAGDVLRFRHVESSSTEVNGNPYSGRDLVHEYTLTVKTLRPDGGVDAELRYDRVAGKVPGRAGSPSREFDSGKPPAEEADPAAKIMVSLATALTTKPLLVTLDARGGLVAVKGLREIWMETIKGTQFEKAFSPEKDFSDAKCVEEVAPLFCAAPAEAHTVGAAWTAQVEDRIDSQSMDFAAKYAVSVADAEKAVVAAKFDWKPGPEAVANGAKATGGGSVAATFSRKDGFLTSLAKKLNANRDTGPMKATSHTTHTIERLAAPPAKGKGKGK
jgi:hypothetical protein